mgnify:CR=1 FL=1
MSVAIVEQDGKRLRVDYVRTPKGVWVAWPGGSALVTDARAHGAAQHKEEDIRAPMTGKIIKIAVAPGEHVEADALLVVMEAMKMEYRLTAPHAGVVETVTCAQGDQVELGTRLVTLEEPEA